MAERSVSTHVKLQEGRSQPLASCRGRRSHRSIPVAAKAWDEQDARTAGIFSRTYWRENGEDESRRTSGRSATFSGRWDVRGGTWESGTPSPSRRKPRQSQTWGRQMPGDGRPQRMQQGPVQPAVWSDRPPASQFQQQGSESRSQSAPQNGESNDRKSSSPKETPFGSTEASSPASDTSNIESQNANAFGDSPAAAPTINRGDEINRPAPASSTAEVDSANAATGAGFEPLQWPRFRQTVRDMADAGIPGFSSNQPSSRGPKDAAGGSGAEADDWALYESSISELDDGWGSNQGQGRASATPRFGGSQPAQRPIFGDDVPDDESPAAGGEAAAVDEEELEAEEWGWEGDSAFPDITPLAAPEVEELLPVVPTPEQMGASWGSAVDVWQRLGAAAFLTLITAKLNMILVASGSATYPFWGPVLNAANRNRALRKSGRHAGFWRANVLDIRVERPQRRRYTDRTVAPPLARATVCLLLGDESGARSQLNLPFNRRYEQIQIGEPAEALVLSNSPRFETFKALKEVYLPVSGLWLTEYPHLNRDVFLDISLDIERERRREGTDPTEATT